MSGFDQGHHLIQCRAPAFMETHLLMLLTAVLVSMDYRGGIACALPMICERDSRGEEELHTTHRHRCCLTAQV